MDIQQARQDGIVIVAPAGRVDSTTSETLERALSGAIDAGDVQLVVDFARVDYISSAGLRVLLVAAKRIADVKGRLVLCSLRESVRQVFDLAGFLPLFALESSRELAVARIGKK